MSGKVIITERQQALLQDMTVSRSCPQGLARRAEIILLAFGRHQNDAIAKQVGCERPAVGVWRRRWTAAFPKLIHAECLGRPGALRRMIDAVLSDDARPGRPGKFSADQVALIIAVACEPPAQSGRPITHWTTHELAAEVSHRKIVPTISARPVGRFLKDGGPPAPPQPVLAQFGRDRYAGISAAGPGGL